MSIELIVFTDRPRLDRQTLKAEWQSPELPETLRWEIAFLPEPDLTPAPDEGPLTGGVVLGWHAESPHAPAIVKALAPFDKAAIDRLSAQNAIASAYLTVTEDDQEEWPDFVADVGDALDDPRHLHFLKKAKRCYTIETSATRNDLSVDFQTQLWRMIEVLTYGLSYDPQEGEVDMATEDGDGSDDPTLVVRKSFWQKIRAWFSS